MTKAANLSALGSNVTTAGNISSESTLTLQTNSTTAITVDSSQRVAFVAGTAALPAITTAGDTNTGMWFPAADTIAFAEGGTESMRIDSSGNVGIGTTSPDTKLTIAGGGGAAVIKILDGGDIQMNNAANTGSTTIYCDTDQVLNVTGSIVASASLTAFSDARLKTNVKTIDNALDKVTQLRGVTFDKDGVEGLGVIAQEVQKVLPQVVLENTDENKTLSVAYGNIVGVLIEAIKELKQEVDELKKNK